MEQWGQCATKMGGSLGNVLCKNRFWTNYVFITVWRSQDPFPHSGSPRNLLGFIFASFSFLSSPGLPPQQSAVEDWPPPGSWPGGGSDHRAFGSSPPPGRGAASSRKGGVDFPRAACAGMGVLPIRSGQRGKVAPRPPPTLPSHRRLCKTWQGVGWFTFGSSLADGQRLLAKTKICQNAGFCVGGPHKALWRPPGFGRLCFVSFFVPPGFLAPMVPLWLDFHYFFTPGRLRSRH